MKRGLLLGAGFSYDLGMPLAREYTEMLFRFLSEKKMRSILEVARTWKPYGEDRPLALEAIDQIGRIHQKFIASKSSNYEEFFKLLEEEQKKARIRSYQDTYNAMIGKLKAIVNEAFWLFQCNTYLLYLANRNLYYRFLREFAEDELWVFSLNHDLMVEMLCIDDTIPLRVGGKNIAEYPWSNQNTKTKMRFCSWNASETDITRLHFFCGVKGINLVKLHGGLNEFTEGDDVSRPRQRLFVDPSEYASSFDYLQQVGKLLHEVHYYYNGMPVRLGGEICFSKDDLNMHFLRPSILTGGHKYHTTLNKFKEEEKMSLFSSGLEQVDELFVIGYSFSDRHINNRIKHAMHKNDQMRVRIVEPGNCKYDGFEPFRYGSRVGGIQSGFPKAARYLLDGIWDESIPEQLKRSECIRQCCYQNIETVFNRN